MLQFIRKQFQNFSKEKQNPAKMYYTTNHLEEVDVTFTLSLKPNISHTSKAFVSFSDTMFSLVLTTNTK